ncbi:MAG: hypothetical protein RQ743_05115 [Bacteroidales bacterium]|nr:hypothetical protein [Bacteroidales bacterium]
MKPLVKIFISLLVLAMVSCGQSQTKDETTVEDVQQEAEELVEETQELVSGESSDFQNNMETKFQELKDKSGDLADDAKAEYEAALQELKSQREALNEKMEEFKNAAEDQKEEMGKEIQNLQDALKKSIEAFEEEYK